MSRIFSFSAAFAAMSVSGCATELASPPLPEQHDHAAASPNIIFVLTDDQRYDAIGALDPNIDTPVMDKMLNEGVHFENAFVTTSLCSPSRATLLTGQYMHTHGVVDNNRVDVSHLEFFPERLQMAGYQTAFIGKWHMGAQGDDPQPGFDHWVSFKGQGHYRPINNGNQSWLNVNGARVPQTDYITDELTDYALNWLGTVDQDQPFLLYLSHKAVHADFIPAERHQDLYADRLPDLPASGLDTPENRDGKPLWVQNQRNSWHGIDFPYHSDLDVREYRREYNRSLSAVDDSLGELLTWLDQAGLSENTIVVLMGDNGFMFGEHGLIDKRNAYEESMRVPLIMYAPSRFVPGTKIDEVVANLDIAPTILAWAGLEVPDHYEGRSMATLIEDGEDETWRDTLFYEYFWEYDFPSTPTTFAIRTPTHKLIQYHGVWDLEELYNLVDDPHERVNLIDDPASVETKVALRKALFEGVQNAQGENLIRYTQRTSSGTVFRHEDRSQAAEFPERWLRPEGAPDRLQQFTPDSVEKIERFGTITEPKSVDEADP
ncbi:MAG: sulfatase family protein [Henriciella sp.]